MHRGIGLHPEQLRHLHRARRTQPPDVIAQQIDNHDVLCAVFGAGLQRIDQRCILRGVGMARHGALHGARFDHALRIAPKKQLGGARQHHRPHPNIEPSAIRHRLHAAQSSVQRLRGGCGACAQRKGEVGLVTIALRNIVFQHIKGSGVLRLVPVWRGGAKVHRCGIGIYTRQQGRGTHGGMVHFKGQQRHAPLRLWLYGHQML